MSEKVDLVAELREAFRSTSPFCHGLQPVPQSHQLLLYYGQQDPCRRIDFAQPTEEQLENLYRACKPALFGLGQQDVLDETYRKAGKLDLDSFSTSFDPLVARVNRALAAGLLTCDNGVLMELYKLNVYGKGDFFKPHKDTPRGRNMFGSLVVVFPTPHEGGQLVLRQGGKEWIVDTAKILSSATEPSVCFIAFFSDVEHEVLPVSSGYRVTLTYNLSWEVPESPTIHPEPSDPSPFYQTLKNALTAVVNNEDALPDGGYLGFGLRHQYVFDEVHSILDLRLKGADLILAAICDGLGLKYSLKLLYRDMDIPRMTVITDKKLNFDLMEDDRGFEYLFLEAVHGLTIEHVEGVHIVGQKLVDPGSFYNWEEAIENYYRDPVTQVLEVEPMSSVGCQSEYVEYGNEASVGYMYGSVTLLVHLDPWKSRKRL